MTSEIKDLKSHPAICFTPERFLKELEETRVWSLQKEHKSLIAMEDTLSTGKAETSIILSFTSAPM